MAGERSSSPYPRTSGVAENIRVASGCELAQILGLKYLRRLTITMTNVHKKSRAICDPALTF